MDFKHFMKVIFFFSLLELFETIFILFLINIFFFVCLTKIRILNFVLIYTRFLARVVLNVLLSMTPVTDVLVAAANAPVEPILNGVWVGPAIFVSTALFAVVMGGSPFLILGLITVDSIFEHVSRDSKIKEDVVTSIVTTLKDVQEQSDFPNLGTTLYQGFMDPAVQKAVEAGGTLPLDVRIVGGVIMVCYVGLYCVRMPILFWLMMSIEYAGRLVYEYKPSTPVREVVSDQVTPPNQVVDQIIVVVTDTPADMTVFYYVCIFGVFLCIPLFFVALFRK